MVIFHIPTSLCEVLGTCFSFKILSAKYISIVFLKANNIFKNYNKKQQSPVTPILSLRGNHFQLFSFDNLPYFQVYPSNMLIAMSSFFCVHWLPNTVVLSSHGKFPSAPCIVSSIFLSLNTGVFWVLSLKDFLQRLDYFWPSSMVALVVKSPPASVGDIRDVGSIPGLGRSPWRRVCQTTPVFSPGESHG